MKVIDLYHHLSRALYYDIKSKKLIDGDEALELRSQIFLGGNKNVGWHGIEKKLKADVWNSGMPIIIYGYIYEI